MPLSTEFDARLKPSGRSVDVTTANVMTVDADELRASLFGLIEAHHRCVVLDPPLYVRLLGEYAALYQYMSELYVFLVGKVRSYTQAGNTTGKLEASNRRDCLEQILKALKLQYDALSRKVTVMSEEGNE